MLRPLDVVLLGNNSPLSAGNTYNVTCQSVGSRPAAEITWWMGSQRLSSAREEVSNDGNTTRSVLTLTPGLEEVGQQLLRALAALAAVLGLDHGSSRPGR